MGSGVRFEPRLIADRYQLTAHLGHGGMADVYRARDTRLDRDVAVKVFHSVTDSIGHHRFAEEARILARLTHPGLVTVHDSGFSDGDPFLVMHLVAGKTLAARLADGPLPVLDVLALARQLAGILAYVHDVGIVHRDVKPSNVLLGDDEQAYLADFGISRLIGTGDRVTEAGKIIGTVGYLSPEQVLGADATRAVDVYALGLVLLECVTGRPEYEGIGVEAAIARLHRPPRVPDDLIAPLSTAIEAMTETKPERRPSMAECMTLLEGRPRSRRARRRRAVLGAATAGAAAVASVSVALLAGSGEITQPPALAPAVDHGERPTSSPAQEAPGPSGDLAAAGVGQPVHAPVTAIVPTNDATHGTGTGTGTGNNGHGKANGAGKGNGKGPRH